MTRPLRAWARSDSAAGLDTPRTPPTPSRARPARARWLLAILLPLSSLASSAQTPPSVSVPPDLDRILREYARAWTAGDLAALARLFSPVGMALPNGQPPAIGSDAIRRAYAQGAGSPLSLRPFAYEASGDLAYVIGGFGGPPGTPDLGKFVLVFRRAADGQWKIAADIDNLNAMPRPAPTHPAAPAASR